MTEFSEKLAKPYRQDCQSLEEHANYAQQLPLQVAPKIKELPDLVERANKDAIPYWKKRVHSLEDRLRPIDTRALHDARDRLGQIHRITWNAPAALRIRALNTFYRLAITLVLVVKLSLILGLIYLFMRLIWYLA